MSGSFLIFLFFLQISHVSSIYSIKTLITPSYAYGGVIFGVQPSVEIVQSSGLVALGFSGSVYVKVYSGPTRYENVWLGSCDAYENCGEISSISNAATIVDGVATFTNLMLKTAGNYTLEYIALDDTSNFVSSVISDSFKVITGEKFKLIFKNYIWSATGGLPFKPNPIIAVVDRGNNIITTMSAGYVAASLSSSHNPTNTTLGPVGQTKAYFVNGIATFVKLYINKTGGGYQLHFQTNLALSGSKELTSATFAVSIGPPAYLTQENNMSAQPILAGEYFKITPRLKIRDAGGNVVNEDCTSEASIALHINPSDATLGPDKSLRVTAENGTLRFSSLFIDKVGKGFSLRYAMFPYTFKRNNYSVDPLLQLTSPGFDVSLGPARKLSIATAATGAWAGAQPMDQQPVLTLLDYGDNIITTDYSSVAVTSIVTSLSVEKTLKIDPTTSTTVNVTRVRISPNNGTFTAGDVILFSVTFSHEVWLAGTTTPYLTLNADTSDGSIRSATLVSSSQQEYTWSFQYVVQSGDSSAALDYTDTAALHSNSADFNDGNGNAVDLTLPAAGSISSRYTVAVNTLIPVATAVNCSSPDGEYGAGEHIHIYVTYDQAVSVTGRPFLELNVRNGSAWARATYQDIHSNNQILHFVYVVGKGDNSTLSALSLAVSRIQLGSSDYLLRLSATPTIAANLTVDPTYLNRNIVIDTALPVINTTYGVTTTSTSGTYYTGHVIYLYLSFTKPVTVVGHSAVLYVENAPGKKSAALFSRLLPDAKTIEFRYRVEATSNTSQLDIIANGSALQFIANDNGIYRKSTHPITPVDVSTALLSSSGHSLKDRVTVALDGYIATVASLSAGLANGTALSGQNLHPDDSVLINVTFSTPVTVRCSPVLVLQVGTHREAQFLSGNNTHSLLFEYVVSIGDHSTGLYYRYLPNALCAVSGCPAPQQTHHSSCGIFSAATVPTLLVDLRLPWRNGHKSTGVYLGHVNVLPDPVLRNTTVTAISCLTGHGSYGTGDTLAFNVTFSDEVVFRSFGGRVHYPRLFLNNGKYAAYFSGIGSKTLEFFYTIASGDDVSAIDIAAIGSTTSALLCNTTVTGTTSSRCQLVNRVGVPVDTDTSALPGLSSGVKVATDPPQVTAVWTDKETSPYDGSYTIGEKIVIFVEFSSPVLVTGPPPRLEVDLNNSNRYAIFDSLSSNHTTLTFHLWVEAGDYSEDLSHSGPYAMVLTDSKSIIYRKASNPQTVANTTLPLHRKVAKSGNVVRIDTSTTPAVTNVTCNATTARYAPGDVILITVHFSHHVVVTGAPYLQLNTGGHMSIATYAGYAGNNTVDYSKKLNFRYAVAVSDYTLDLDYIDAYSLFRGVTSHFLPGTILLQASTSPTVHASLELPQPGSIGSLSYQHDVQIDGLTPYLTSLAVLNPNGVYYVDDVIQIEMTFSAPVAVVGVPGILLETGTIDRQALYASGSGGSALLLKYVVQPGDTTSKLDYHASRTLLLSCNGSYYENGGGIYSLSSAPTLKAAITLNPIGGYLTGTTSGTSVGGYFNYEDLAITSKGPDYQLRYTCTPHGRQESLSVVQPLFVSFSNEFEMRASDALSGDRVGWAVDISGDIAVLGAPYSNYSTVAVQTVTTTASAGATPVQQIQLLGVEVAPQVAIQSFYTTADAYQTIGGYFTIDYGIIGPSRPIPSNALPDQIHAILAYDMPKLGNVTVTREPYIYCGCEGAFVWTLTFNDKRKGYFHALTLNGNKLTGGNAAIVGPTVIQSSAWLGGSYKLVAHGATTGDIPFDADAETMVSALLELSYPVVDVQISPADASRSRTYTITFGAYMNSYDLALLDSDSSQLTGGNCTVWAEIVRAGVLGPTSSTSGGLYGGFTLTWRGNTTTYLAYNASASQMAEALEALPIINDVSVTRSSTSTSVGYTWTVTFISVNSYSQRGYAVDYSGSLEPMTATNYLIGTDTNVEIGAVWNSSTGYNVWSPVQLGSYGTQAGSVYVFQKIDDVWIQVAKIIGNDSTEIREFGTSVSLSSGVLIVGSPGSSSVGLPEIQSIYCSADNGTFKITFRGWTTAPIPFDVTVAGLKEAMEGPSDTMINLHSMHDIEIKDWGGGGLCANNTAEITFLSPVDGNEELFGVDNRGNLEPIQIVNDYLTFESGIPGVINVTTIRDGTWRVHNHNVTGKQLGAAYVFRSKYTCNYNQTVCKQTDWVQEAQFYPVSGNGFDRFGTSVAVDGNRAAVGAPGAYSNYGEVYVYKYTSSTKSWKLLNRVTAAVWSSTAGDLFGYSLDLDGRTLVIGSPGRENGKGSVYIFEPTILGAYQAEEEIRPTNSSGHLLSKGDFYGGSVSISNDVVLIGACQRDASTVYLGDQKAAAAKNTGSVYVFQRASYVDKFSFVQILEPSNVKAYDLFGWDVSLSGNVAIVSAVESFSGNLTASKTIMEVATSASYSKVPVGGSFILQWQVKNVTGSWEYRESRFIPYDVSATDMRTIIESDLDTGMVLVSRSNKGAYDGSYVWTVTFVGQTGYVAPLTADTHELTGTNPTVTITVTNPTPLDLRGLTHVFTRAMSSDLFVEQLYASPFSHQPVDRCGWSIAVDGYNALLGCPNRDTYTSNQNAGSGIIFDLNLLRLQFSKSEYEVSEGKPLTVKVTRTNAYSGDIEYYLETLDRNSNYSRQVFLSKMYGIGTSSVPYPLLVSDVTGLAGTAIARPQQSLWIEGVYDYRALSDYYPVSYAAAFLSENSTLNYTILTNSDMILEVPDENATLIIYSPGLWPSMLGNLFSRFTILDDGDGYAPVTTTVQYEKLFAEKAPVKAEIGHAVDVNAEVNMIATGCPRVAVTSLSEAGVVYLHRLLLHHWALVKTLQSPSPVLNGHFGDDVKIDKGYGKNATTIVVAEPGAMKVHVYTWTSGKVFKLETSLQSEDANVIEHRFATRGTIALAGDVLIVGAPVLEAVYVYIRYTNTTSSKNFIWKYSSKLRSSDFDYDMLYSYIHLHRQEFGTAVAVSGRTIGVGAPYADYDKLGTQYVEVDWDTEGTDIKATGRGRAYMYYSTAPEQVIHLSASQQLFAGSFKLHLNYNGRNATTTMLYYNTTTSSMKSAIEDMKIIDQVTVSFSNTILGVAGVNYIWTVTFDSEWADPPLLEAVWHDHNCSSCIPFDYPASNVTAIVVTRSKVLGSWTQYLPPIYAGDRRQGDRFGAAIALDGNQLVVSAPYSSSITTTTWDFECGCLEGWSVQGTAFSYQPTFGDNSYVRAVYRGDPSISLLGSGKSSRLRGRYYVGTYEQRPGNKTDYKNANSSYPAGSTQGDSPTGTMSSQVFMINGQSISFLIGGGCDASTEYVELLVDGFGVYKATGKCTERMESVTFDVSLYQGRAGQIRVVDAGISTWGHINVDDFQFDWEVSGSVVNGTSSSTNRQVFGGVLETVHSGAVYLFRRHKASSDDFCVEDIGNCVWSEETKITASDKRANDGFGTSIRVNDAAGVLVVGSPAAAFTGFYKESPVVYPYKNTTTDVSDLFGTSFPVSAAYMTLFQEQPSGSAQASGASAVWYLQKLAAFSPDTKGDASAGAVYVFVRVPATTNAGSVTVAPHWYYTETVKIQPPDEFARDYFGTSVAISDDLILIGAPGQDMLKFDSGALYLFRAGFAALSFTSAEYIALEGRDEFALISVERNSQIYSGSITVEYTTSDLTALAVNASHFLHCLQLPPHDRGPAQCGDYQQLHGYLTIDEGKDYGALKLPITDNLCRSHYLRYVQFTLSVPGSAALQGEAMSAKIRIDDDDFNRPLC